MRSWRNIWIILLVFGVSFCQGEKNPPKERIIRFPAEDWGFPSPLGFYPAGPGYLRMSLLFDCLVWKDEKGIIPWLAKSWQVKEKGKLWEFKLREGVKFHNGKILTCEDVAFSYQYLSQHHFPWVNFSPIEKVSCKSADEVIIQLKEPYAPFLEKIAGVVPILPKHIWEKVSEPRRFHSPEALVGTGPFILEKYEAEHGIYIYRANPDFFLGKAGVDKLAWVPCGDVVLGLEKGEIDAHTLWWQSVDAVERFKDDSRYRILEGKSDWVLKLIFNTKKPLLNDPRVRKAIARAIDRAKLCLQVKHNHALPGNPGILPPYHPWYNPEVEKYSFSLSRAEELLKEAGFTEQDSRGILKDKSGRRLSLSLVFAPQYSREAEFIQQSLKKIGIEIKFRSLDLKTLFSLLNGDWSDFDLALNGHGGVAGDPDLLREWFLTPMGNNGFWQEKGFIQLAKKQKSLMDPAQRKLIIFQLQKIIADQIPVLILYYPRIYLVYNPKVFDRWFYTQGGIAIGIPTPLNKLAFLR